MAKVTRTPLEKDLRKAYKEVYNNLSSIGNGYGWAAEEVLAVLAPVIKKHAEDFDIDKVWYMGIILMIHWRKAKDCGSKSASDA